jgi:hypothetical protein
MERRHGGGRGVGEGKEQGAGGGGRGAAAAAAGGAPFSGPAAFPIFPPTQDARRALGFPPPYTPATQFTKQGNHSIRLEWNGKASPPQGPHTAPGLCEASLAPKNAPAAAANGPASARAGRHQRQAHRAGRRAHALGN